jgi:hypothetical protein
MNEFERAKPGQEYTTFNPERETETKPPEFEQYRGNSPEQPATSDLHKKTPAELAHLEEIRQRLEQRFESQTPPEPTIPKNPTETEIIAGQTYHIEYVPKEDIYPAYGYGGGNSVEVRQDLSPRVKRFVKAHELYHCRDKASWGGWLGREIRANVVPGLKDPIGLAATAWKTITDIDRIKLYLDRIRRGY